MSTPKFTPQQAAAIDTRRVSIGLSAGAGCGKTFVLTQRFLKHLEPGPDQTPLSALVAITFTDRAAREMRDRVRAACQARLDQCAPDDVAYWLTILRGLDAARISTIHSFCTMLLRAHAIEAGINPQFAVLEAALSEALLETAAREVVHRRLIADDDDVTAFVLRLGLEATRDKLARLARQRFRVDWSAWPDPSSDELAEHWREHWHKVTVPKLLRDLWESPHAVAMLSVLSANTPSHEEMGRRRAEILAASQEYPRWTDPLAALTALRDDVRVQGGGGKSAWDSEEIYEQVQKSLTKFRAELDKTVEKLESNAEDDVGEAADFAVRGMRLTREVAQAYESAKADVGVLDFDDLLLRARDLLRQHPQVEEKLAASIRLLMVDEFQDTDPVQAEIVRRLCGAAIRHGRLFLVGDIKQSIYRFRRADPQVFLALRKELPAEGQLSLTRNFRSQPEILNFVNLLFGPRFDRYEALEPHTEQRSPRPAIEFLWATSDAVPPVDPPAKLSVEDLRRREADWIARRLSQLLDDPTPRVRDRDPTTGQPGLRRVRPGDIVLLFRAMTNVQLYESALRNFGLDYYLVGGKAFFAQQEIHDVLNLCQYLIDSEDLVALIGVLRSPFFGLSDDTIQTLSMQSGSWPTRLEHPDTAISQFQQERARFAARTLVTLRESKDRLPIAEMLESAISLTGFDAALLAEHLGARKVANLRKLIEQARAFDRGELFTLPDFVERLKRSVLEETDEEFATTLPETGNVIRLMTIHQSKGLEFPVVVIADIERGSQSRVESPYLHATWGALVKLPDRFGVKSENLALQMLNVEEKDAAEEESLRLFYVATTRAADHLIVSAGLESAADPSSSWMLLLSERWQLETGLLKFDSLLGTFAGLTDPATMPHILVHREPPLAEPRKSLRERPPLATFSERLTQAEPEPLPRSAERLKPVRGAPQTLSVSRLETHDAVLQGILHEGERAPDTNSTSAENLGRLVHAVLEAGDYAAPEEWPELLVRFARGLRLGEDDAALLARAEDILDRIAQSPFPAKLASARQLHRELDFVLQWPNTGTASPHLISGQIDLVYELPDGEWGLLDFKTGRYRADQDDASILAPYTFQLGIYALAFEQWLERPLSEISLLITQPAVREIRWAFPKSERAAFQNRITAAIAAACADEQGTSGK